MLYSEETVRANIRNRDGKRVFFLRNGDALTPSARDFLTRERIPILSASDAPIAEYQTENGAVFPEKPEHFTHLRGNILVPKSHPIIAFRGAIDTLQAELLLAQQAAPASLCRQLEEILTLARHILRWDVMEEPATMERLCGLTPQQLRQHSHDPQTYYGQPHFMPAHTDSATLLQLNRCRCAARNAELCAARAFENPDCTCRRTDLLQALNRMSSMLYILMIQCKKEQ